MLKRKNKPLATDEDYERPGLIGRIKLQVKEWIHFLTYDIWRLNPENFSGKKNIFHNVLKIIMLTVRGIQEQDLSSSSRSLTYRTILSIVPMFAVIFAIARGFGFEKIVESQIFNFFQNNDFEVAAPISTNPETDYVFPGTESAQTLAEIEQAYHSMEVATEPTAQDTTTFTIQTLIKFVNNSLEHAKGGVFTGVGVILLLYTIVLLFTDIENSFNRIWGIKKGRALQRRMVDYFALVLFLPVFAIVNYSLTAIIQAYADSFDKFSQYVTPVISSLLGLLPFAVMILSMILLYKFMPNTKVKWISALIGGVIGGIALQVFQIIYLEGQLWISKYNAIYGAFAALPLLLLWTQVSWFIVLIGAELSFSVQNVDQFSFDKETKNISRRYRDFFTIVIVSVIAKRFSQGKEPLSAAKLSLMCKVPIKLTNDIIDEMIKLGVVLPTPKPDDERVMAFQPAYDIHDMSVGSLLDKIDRHGSEDFLLDESGRFSLHWSTLMESRMSAYEKSEDVLLKDL